MKLTNTLLTADRALEGTWEAISDYLVQCFTGKAYCEGIEFFERLQLKESDYLDVPNEWNKMLIMAAACYTRCGRYLQALTTLRIAERYGHCLPGFYDIKDRTRLYPERQLTELESVFCHPYFIEHSAPVSQKRHFAGKVETTPFCWFETGKLTRKNQKCELTGKVLEKGQQVYQFRYFTGSKDSVDEFLVADIACFDASEKAKNNRQKYENNHYQLSDYVINTDYGHPYISYFYQTLSDFNLLNTLKIIARPPVFPTDSALTPLINHGEEHYVKNSKIFAGSGGMFVELLYVLIKCGYLPEIIKLLPQLPEHMPYLLLMFQSELVRKSASEYLNNSEYAEVIDKACIPYQKKKTKEVADVARFGRENPDFMKNIAVCLNLYELYICDGLLHYPNWNIQDFTYIRRAHCGGLLDFFITDTQPMSLLNDIREQVSLVTNKVGHFHTDRLEFAQPFLYRVVILNLAYTHNQQIELWLDRFATITLSETVKVVHKKTLKLIPAIQKLRI